MSNVIKMQGRLLTFDKVDKCNILVPKDCKITYPEMLPILFNFDRSDVSKVLGNASVTRDDSGLICDAIIYDENVIKLLPEFNNKFPIGGFYTRLKDHVHNNIRMIDEGFLSAVSVTLSPASADYEMVLVEESEEE